MNFEALNKVFERVAAALETVELDHYFCDPRGGFLSILQGTRVFLRRESYPENIESLANSYLDQCELLLEEVSENGISSKSKNEAFRLAKQIKEQQWGQNF
ncbi:hypothetical protein [Microbulbifer agarilyticus]